MFPVPSHVDFVRVGGQYQVGKLLGSGSSLGSVYLGRDIRTKVEIAVKIGRADDPSSRLRPEYNVYTEIAGGIGIPPVRWYGKEGRYEVIIMDHLGTSLDDLVSKGQIDQEKIFQYAPQMLSAVESLHTRHYVHCDIKPANFMVCTDNLNPTVFLIDFGLAQLFHNPAMYLHVPFSTDSPDISTLPFLSINSQHGFTPSCCDDLESLAYTIIYSARSDLPWMTIHCDQETILQMKTITAGELCEGLPTPFCKFVSYSQ
ncbi:Protein kinase-like domain containing protein, partial [Lactarius tabidus]